MYSDFSMFSLTAVGSIDHTDYTYIATEWPRPNFRAVQYLALKAHVKGNFPYRLGTSSSQRNAQSIGITQHLWQGAYFLTFTLSPVQGNRTSFGKKLPKPVFSGSLDSLQNVFWSKKKSVFLTFLFYLLFCISLDAWTIFKFMRPFEQRRTFSFSSKPMNFNKSPWIIFEIRWTFSKFNDFFSNLMNYFKIWCFFWKMMNFF